MQKIKSFVNVCGGTFSAMSGVLSIPFTFYALFHPDNPKFLFAVLGYCALFVYAFSVTHAHSKQIAANKALLDQRKQQEIDRNMLGGAIDALFVQLQNVQEFDPYGKTMKEVNELRVECDKAIQVAVVFIKTVSSVEALDFATTENGAYEVSCTNSAFYEQCRIKAILMAALKSRINAAKVLLHKKL